MHHPIEQETIIQFASAGSLTPHVTNELLAREVKFKPVVLSEYGLYLLPPEHMSLEEYRIMKGNGRYVVLPNPGSLGVDGWTYQIRLYEYELMVGFENSAPTDESQPYQERSIPVIGESGAFMAQSIIRSWDSTFFGIRQHPSHNYHPYLPFDINLDRGREAALSDARQVREEIFQSWIINSLPTSP